MNETSSGEELKPTSKFKGRLGNSAGEFGNVVPESEEKDQEESTVVTKGAKTRKTKDVKTQETSEQKPGTEGRQFYLPPDLHKWLKIYAVLAQKSMSDIVVEELENLRKKHPISGLQPNQEYGG